jgi:hypothetical protein
MGGSKKKKKWVEKDEQHNTFMELDYKVYNIPEYTIDSAKGNSV